MKYLLLLLAALPALARPDYLGPAMKFGAKNCAFCHKEAAGGEGWNDRGRWLIQEKQDRNVPTIQVEWLKFYKPAPPPAPPKPAAKKPATTKS